ncbi:hypothetical protein EJ110_NYTH09381 [Nymphaea thermarum]|nr:hypothetical protein EJ110_NYTH09381 [Nymphaea thermarum]
MAGLLAWAADVVGGNGGGINDDEFPSPRAVVFSPEQEAYVREREAKARELRRSIGQLRARLPPPHISQRLPHLHAHSVASNAALALQVDSHSATRQETQLREASLQEENAAYEKAVSNGQKQIQEKMQEASILENKLKEMESSEGTFRDELDKLQATWENRRSAEVIEVETNSVAIKGTDLAGTSSAGDLEKKKIELKSLEEQIHNLENMWSELERDSLKQPSPAQREKLLEKQLHSLLEQLATKQAQAEELTVEIHAKEHELEKLNAMQLKLDSASMETNMTRNRMGRFGSLASGPSHDRPGYGRDHLNLSGLMGDTTGSRVKGRSLPSGRQQKLMLARSAFVLYILTLHLLVFIKISSVTLGRRS